MIIDFWQENSSLNFLFIYSVFLSVSLSLEDKLMRTIVNRPLNLNTDKKTKPA